MKIVEVRTSVVSLPRAKTLKTSYGSGDMAITVIVELHSDDGLVGVGQTAVAPRSYGETAEGMAVNIHTHLAPLVINQAPFNIEYLNQAMQRALPHHWSSHAGIELALWDLKARALGVPVYELLGGKVRDGVNLMGFIHHDTPEKMAEETQRVLAAESFPVLKMKIGLNPKDDIKRYRAVANATEGRAVMQVDGNTGYTLSEAIPALSVMEDIGVLGAVEQPLARIEDMAELAQRLRTPLMADEAIYSPEDATEVLCRKAATLALMKITKHGGLLNVQKIAAIFDAAGFSLSVAIYYDFIAAVAAHAAAAFPCVRWPSPYTYLQDTLLEEPFEPEGLLLRVPAKPGWGVTLDAKKLKKYALATQSFS